MIKRTTLVILLVALCHGAPFQLLDAPPPIDSEDFVGFGETTLIVSCYFATMTKQQMELEQKFYDKLYDGMRPFPRVIGYRLIAGSENQIKLDYENAIPLPARENGLVPLLFDAAVNALIILEREPNACLFQVTEDMFLYEPFRRRYVLSQLHKAYCHKNAKEPDFFVRMVDRVGRLFGVFKHPEISNLIRGIDLKLTNHPFRRIVFEHQEKRLGDKPSTYDLAKRIFGYNQYHETSEKVLVWRELGADPELYKLSKTDKSLYTSISFESEGPIYKSITIENKAGRQKIRLPEDAAFFVFICDETDLTHNACFDLKSSLNFVDGAFVFDILGTGPLKIETVAHIPKRSSDSHRPFLEFYLSKSQILPKKEFLGLPLNMDLSREIFETRDMGFVVYCQNSASDHVLMRVINEVMVFEERITLEEDIPLPTLRQTFRIPPHKALASSRLCTNRYKQLFILSINEKSVLYVKKERDSNSEETKHKVLLLTKPFVTRRIIHVDCESTLESTNPIYVQSDWKKVTFTNTDVTFEQPTMFLESPDSLVDIRSCIKSDKNGGVTYYLKHFPFEMSQMCLNHNSHASSGMKEWVKYNLIYAAFGLNACWKVGWRMSIIPNESTFFFHGKYGYYDNALNYAFTAYAKRGKDLHVARINPDPVIFSVMPEGIELFVSGLFSSNKYIKFRNMMVFYLSNTEVIYALVEPVADDWSARVKRTTSGDKEYLYLTDSLFFGTNLESATYKDWTRLPSGSRIKKVFETHFMLSRL